MKRIYRLTLCVLAAALLLTVPVFADIGPKPKLVVRVEDGPEELYYLDILREGKNPYTDETVGGLEGCYSEEEYAALDQDLLEDFIAAIPENWFGCVTQGKLVWGNIDSQDGYHSFDYIGVPDVCRILMVTKSGETFLSEPVVRQVLQSSVTVDWAAKTVKAPPLSLGYAAQFLATFLPTLAIEGVLLLLFRLWSKRNGLVFLLVNLVTQGGLTLWCSVKTVCNGTFWVDWTLSFFGLFIYTDVDFLETLSRMPYYFDRFPEYYLIPAELVILLVEMALYLRLFRGEGSKKRTALYAAAANVCSFVLGLRLMDPVWKFVVQTFL